MSILDLKTNLLTLYADQLVKAEGDIKNNPHLSKEVVEYRNRHGMLVRKTVYRNREPAEPSSSDYEDLASHQDLLAGDVIRCTTKSGKVVTGSYTRKTSQVKKGVKTEFLEFIKPDGSKGYVTLNGSVKLERQKLLASQDTSSKDLAEPEGLTLLKSLDELKKLGCNVQQVYPNSSLAKVFELEKFDLLAIYQEYKASIEKATKGKILINPRDFMVKIYPTKVSFVLQTRGIEIDRDISFAEKSVENHYLKISSEFQNADLAKNLFRIVHRQYLKAGVETIKVFANIDIGAYSWMAYGFSAKTDEATELITNFTAKLGREYISYSKKQLEPNEIPKRLTVTQDDVNRLNEAINGYKLGNPTKRTIPMNILASSSKNQQGDSSFKSWLISTMQAWSGELDLTDSAQKQHFETYIGYNKS